MADFDPSSLPCVICTSLEDVVRLFKRSEQAGGGGRINLNACDSHSCDYIVSRMMQLDQFSVRRGYAPGLARIVRVLAPTDGKKKNAIAEARPKGTKVKPGGVMDFAYASQEICVAEDALKKARELLSDVSGEYLRSAPFTKQLKAVTTVTRKIESLTKRDTPGDEHSRANRCYLKDVQEEVVDILRSEPFHDQMEEIRKFVANL